MVINARLALMLRATTMSVLLSTTASAAPPVSTGKILRAASKKPILFTGRVESIDTKLGTVAVQHGPIPGYLPAMTMDYPVDSNVTLRSLQPDDRITATVYVGDSVLHDVHVVTKEPVDGSPGAGGISSPTVRPAKPAASR
jgi:Cu/Ag efflux protein CusF